MEHRNTGSPDIAKRVLPKGLYEALVFIFAQGITDTILVGGTALSGYYAGHRRSDDLDLFIKNRESWTATVLAVKALQSIGAIFSDEFRTAQYYRAVCDFKEHIFTIDIVLDQNIFRVGQCTKFSDGVAVATLETIFMMKCATLVSRCSEKDLFDLLWLFEHLEGITVSDVITNGQKIDGGVNCEALLLSIGSAELSEKACGFSLDKKENAKQILKQIEKLRKLLLREIAAKLKEGTNSVLEEMVREMKRLV